MYIYKRGIFGEVKGIMILIQGCIMKRNVKAFQLKKKKWRGKPYFLKISSAKRK